MFLRLRLVASNSANKSLQCLEEVAEKSADFLCVFVSYAKWMRVRFPAVVLAFLMDAKSKKLRVFEILPHVEDYQVVRRNPEPSATACLIAQM